MDIQALDRRIAEVTNSLPELHQSGLEFRDWLISADEVRRLRINPYEIAEACNVPVETIVTFALRGLGAGLLDLHWLVHCPHCNMITTEYRNFFELTHSSDCKMCSANFNVDVLKRVEVTFSLNRSIEDADAAAFCLPPPSLNPKVNIAVGPGGTVVGSDIINRPGRYRYFYPITLAKGLLDISGEPTEEPQAFRIHQLPSFNYDQTSLTARPGPGAVSFELINDCDKISGIFIISDELSEELPLENLAPRLTGLEVIHYPGYRDLFGDQALARSEHLQISSVTLMFTDIAGSTAMYETMGNAGAYSTVRQHFDVLFQLIESHGGFVIKTIGDAVMASFPNNDDALSCALEAQRKFYTDFEANSDSEGVRVKFSIHRGPAILVNLNGRIDYFGSAVNRAARIQSSAAPNELVLSNQVRDDSTAAEAFLKIRDISLREEQITMKGIEAGQKVSGLPVPVHTDRRTNI